MSSTGGNKGGPPMKAENFGRKNNNDKKDEKKPSE